MLQVPHPPPPADRLLPARCESLPDVPHPSIPYLDGSGWEIGSHLGSGIDKAAYLLIDGQGEARTDVVVKVARHQIHCDENRQCKNEIEMYEWLADVDHPFKCYFAAVVAIVENITINGAVQTCYLSARCEKIGGYGNGGSEIAEMKTLLTEYFGIYDLHNNNLGHTEDGQPVVLDFGLFAGFSEVQTQWQAAKVALGENATPQQILDSIEPINPGDDPDTENWCDECGCNVSEDHCHCTNCEEERDGIVRDVCVECNTATVESSRLTGDSEIRCNTCLELARENRTAPESHAGSSLVWRMHKSCGCGECSNARTMFNLARGLTCHEPCRDAWAYRPGCPCRWCERARSEHSRLYKGMRISMHRIDSAPPLVPILKPNMDPRFVRHTTPSCGIELKSNSSCWIPSTTTEKR